MRIVGILRGIVMLPVAAIVLLIFVPLGLLVKLLEAIGVLSGDRTCTPAEFAADLRALADGTLDEGAYDELECVQIRDERLEVIRQQTLKMPDPHLLSDKDRAELRRLADDAAALPSLEGKN